DRRDRQVDALGHSVRSLHELPGLLDGDSHRRSGASRARSSHPSATPLLLVTVWCTCASPRSTPGGGRMSAPTGTGAVSPCADLRARQPARIPPCGAGVRLAGDAAPLE